MIAQILPVARRAVSILILAAFPGLLLAQDFEQVIQVDGAANTPDDQLVFGMLPGATDGLDDNEDVVPPSPPGFVNTIAFSPDAVASKLIRDIREPADDKVWRVSATKLNPDEGIALTWDASEWTGVTPLPTVTLSGAALEQDHDLTVASPDGGVVITENATLYVTYGAPVIPEEGSLVVTSDTEGAQWRLTQTDGSDVILGEGDSEVNLSTDALGDPIWRAALPSQVVEGLPPDDYTVTFRDISVAFETPADMTATITDGETTTLTANYTAIPASVVQMPRRITVSEDGSAADVQIALGAEPLADVNVAVATAGANPGAAQITVGDSLSFTAANYNVPQTVTVAAVDDDVDQNLGRRFLLDLTLTSADSRYDAFTPADHVLGVAIDDDEPGLTMGRLAGDAETDETGDQAQCDLVLNSEPTADVTVDILSTDPSEGTADLAQATFTAADWDTAQTVTVTGQDDALTDGDMTYRVVARISSADPAYDGRARALRYINIDDETTAGAPEIVVLPRRSLPFGIIPEGGSRTRILTVFNTGESEALLTAAVQTPTRAEGFTVEGATTFDFALPAGEGVQLEVAAGAKDTANGKQTRAALTFAEQGDATVLKAVALSSLTVPLPQGGTLAIDPELILLDPSGATETEAFDVVLDTETRFGRLYFGLELPSFLTVTDVQTNTDATSGWHFGYRIDGSILRAFYTDPDFDGSESTGIDSGENPVLTVSFEVDTSASGEDVTAPISFLTALAADDTRIYELSWGEDSSTRAADGTDALGASDGLLAVSNKISLADLDVNGDGNFNFADVLLVYRNMDFAQGGAGLNSSNGLLSMLIPAGTTYELTAQEIEDNIVALIENGLNVNGNDSTDFADVLLIYRNLDFAMGGAGLNSANSLLGMLIPAGTTYDLAAEEIEQNIQDLID